MKAKKIWLMLGIVIFITYFLFAVRSIPPETVLIPKWLSSFESDKPIKFESNEYTVNNSLLPFKIGERFGYIDRNGCFSVNRIINNKLSFSPERWAEYENEPEQIEVYNNSGDKLTVIENPRGYPFFIDNRSFLLGSEQNSISEINESGETLWAYEFPGIITCVDSSSGLLLAGTLDGIIEVLDNTGKNIFRFEPGGSKYPVILGCAISCDGSRFAVISGIDSQRFMVFERFGSRNGEYKVAYHEFLDGGFRRPVYVTFTDNDRWVTFECSGGLGIYETGSRQMKKVYFNGDIKALDRCGKKEMVFIVAADNVYEKKLIGIALPGRIMLESPFKSGEIFMDRIDSQLFVGGARAIISFDLDKR